jgi:type IV fimbrial biogenesis protein FimT
MFKGLGGSGQGYNFSSMCKKLLRPQPGFTLIELMVTLVVAVILATIAAPSFQNIIRNNRMATEANNLITALNLARSEAVKRGFTISLCKSSTSTSCGGTGVDWEDGWIVFVNNDNDSPAAVDAGETILRVYPSLSSGYTLRTNNNFTNFISYRPNGTSNNVGRFVLCKDAGVSHSRVVFINIAGRAHVATDSNGNTIPEDENGTDITTCTP